MPRPLDAVCLIADRHSDATTELMAEQARSHFVTLLSSRGSITLLAEVRHRHHLDEPGAQVEVVERDRGVWELTWSFAGPNGRGRASG
jgi:hypothetical protein